MKDYLNKIKDRLTQDDPNGYHLLLLGVIITVGLLLFNWLGKGLT